jgi:hypothetical protein
LFIDDCRRFERRNEKNETEKLLSLIIEIEKKLAMCFQLQQQLMKGLVHDEERRFHNKIERSRRLEIV